MADSAAPIAFTWSRADASVRYQAPEAFLCLVSLAATADGGMAILESEWLQQLTRRWWESGIVKERDVEALNEAVCARLSKVEAVLEEAASALPTPCRLSAYAQALDVMLINGPLNEKEQDFSRRLVQALAIGDYEARFVKNCMVLKNTY